MIVEHKLVGGLVCPLMAIVKQMQTEMMPPGGEYCLGRSCMMWRWVHRGKDVKDQVGYCGLGGIPAATRNVANKESTEKYAP